MGTPTLQGMRAFRAVAETGSFKNAGGRLGLTGSAVSKLVAALESDVGALLLQRTTRSLSLTEAGSSFYDAAVRALDETDNAVELLRSDAVQPRGKLRVSVPTSFALLCLAPRLPDFLVRYPELQLELDLSDRFVDLVAEGFDGAVRIGSDLADSGLVVRRLGAVRRLLVAAPRYVKNSPRLRSPADLVDHKALVHAHSHGGDQWLFLDGAKTTRVTVSGPLVANNSIMLREALLAGLGIAQTPQFVVQDLLQSDRLLEILPAHRPPDLAAFGVTSQRRFVPLKVRLFFEFVEATLRDSGAGVMPARHPVR